VGVGTTYFVYILFLARSGGFVEKALRVELGRATRRDRESIVECIVKFN
jgi:hypothetical protein